MERWREALTLSIAILVEELGCREERRSGSEGEDDRKWGSRTCSSFHAQNVQF